MKTRRFSLRLFFEQTIIKSTNLNILIISFIVFSTGCSSQNHLNFQGIPINGDLKNFAEELKKKGYKADQSVEDNQLKFTGEFLGRQCNVYLATTIKSQTPYMVTVDLPKEPYDSIKSGYEKIRNHCASILGTGASKYQQFNNSSRLLFNEPKRVKELKNGDYTRFLRRKGSVFLEVKFDYLSIRYIDRKNNERSVSEGGKGINLENGEEI